VHSPRNDAAVYRRKRAPRDRLPLARATQLSLDDGGGGRADLLAELPSHPCTQHAAAYGLADSFEPGLDPQQSLRVRVALLEIAHASGEVIACGEGREDAIGSGQR